MKKQEREKWFDEECKKAIGNRKNSRGKALSLQTARNEEEMP